MFAKIALIAVSALTAVSGVTSTPLAIKPSNDLVARTFQSFSGWGGLASLNGFDNFYGVDNFDGSRCEQTIVAVPEHRLVCRAQSVEIVQQRLLVIQEVAKRIITEQICDVETQTIVFEQWHASLHGFSQDLRRISGRQVGFDQSISSHFGSIIGSDGSLSSDNFGFSGRDFGRNTVVVEGCNWEDSRFVSVNAAYRAARDAFHSVH